jgi:hypothetical protein
MSIFYQNNTDNALPFLLVFRPSHHVSAFDPSCHTYAILLVKYGLLKFGSYMHKEDGHVDQSVHAMMGNLLGLSINIQVELCKLILD